MQNRSHNIDKTVKVRGKVNHYSLFVFLLINFISGHAANPIEANDLRQMVQLAEYISADYSEAVLDGKIVNQGEYEEMLDFSEILLSKSKLISSDFKNLVELNNQVKKLKNAVVIKQDIQVISALTSDIQGILLKELPNINLPEQLLTKDQLLPIYNNQCSSCHGASGRGDGALAKTLTPAPTNFTEIERAQNRSILGLFETISNGVDETAMPAFNHFNNKEKWSLAFYVGGLAFNSKKELAASQQNLISVSDFINQSPSRLLSTNSKIKMEQIEWYRNNPDDLFNNAEDSFSIARTQLLAALNAYEKQNFNQASTSAVSAYLDGFELIENSLDSRDQDLRKQIEAKMMGIRQILKKTNNQEKLSAEVFETIELLDQAKYLLAETQLSDGTLFSVSLVIILREGLEALLVIIALTTVLIRTKRRDSLKYVHFGWVSALLAGIATWVVAQSLIAISGASREVMEGVAALLAAIILLYVGVWMHSKSSASQWQSYIKKHINSHLSTGKLWGIAILAFIAVYREVFETVLFYQSLLTQSLEGQYRVIGSGFIAGILVLAVLAWGLVKYSIKLPLSKFFSLTTYLLLALSFILMGKAIAALQEAAIVSATPMSLTFQVDVLGLYSTWEGIGSQMFILLVFILIQYFPQLFKNSNADRQQHKSGLKNEN